MSKNDINTMIKISGAELCFAGQEMGIPRLLLPQDPFRGHVVEEIALELIQAQKRLFERDLYQIGEGGTKKLSIALSNTIEVLGNPDCSIILQQEQISGEAVVVYFHKKEGRWISLEMVESDLYKMEIIEETQMLKSTINGLINIKNGTSDQKITSQIKYIDYFQAQETAREQGLSECKDYLLRICQESETAASLAEDLSNPISSGSVTEWHWQDMEVLKRDGLAFLGGKERLWLVKENPKDATMIQLTQTVRSNLASEISGLIDSL